MKPSFSPEIHHAHPFRHQVPAVSQHVSAPQLQSSLHIASESKRLDWMVMGFLIFAHAAAMTGIFFFSWPAFFSFLGFYIVTALGITLGFHRYFTHRSFKAPRWLEVVMALMGTLALQGPLLEWVAHHRMHHAGSDTPKDPHDAARGFWWSHMVWLFYHVPQFDHPTALRRYARDIANDPVLSVMSRMWFVISVQVALGLVLFAAMGLAGVIWGIFFRLVFVYHVTWLVNSAAHKWGYRTFAEQRDQKEAGLATNNWWVGLLALGEGWHHNHHTYADSARTGYRWWEFDFTWQVIKFLRLMGWAEQVKIKP